MRLEGISLFKCQVLAAVVERAGFHSAAQHLSITQPAVSRHVHDLEIACGAPLFRRQGRRSELTEVGHLMYRFARQVIVGAREAESTLSELLHGERGSISVGVTPGWSSSFLPEVLEQFCTVCPNVAVRIDTGQTETRYTKTLDGTLDFAICVLHDLPEGLEHQTLYEEELVLVAGAHSTAPEIGPEINREQFGRLPFIASSSQVVHAVIQDELQRCGLPRPQVRMAASIEVIKKCVTRGLGISLLGRRKVAADIAAGRMREIFFVGSHELRCRYGLIHRAGQSLSPLANQFVQALRQCI